MMSLIVYCLNYFLPLDAIVLNNANDTMQRQHKCHEGVTDRPHVVSVYNKPLTHVILDFAGIKMTRAIRPNYITAAMELSTGSADETEARGIVGTLHGTEKRCAVRICRC